MAVVRIENVVKHYGAVEAVRGVSLECADGEMMALLGPSGCGKTTMLKMLAGIEDVTSGEIYFDDEPIADRDPSERNIAMVFEDYALYPRLSVAQNIAFPLKIRRMPRSEIRPRLEKALDMLDLQQFRDENVQWPSGGGQRRVSIGRAPVRDPSSILFDEPLSHLDGDQRGRAGGGDRAGRDGCRPLSAPPSPAVGGTAAPCPAECHLCRLIPADPTLVSRLVGRPRSEPQGASRAPARVSARRAARLSCPVALKASRRP